MNRPLNRAIARYLNAHKTVIVKPSRVVVSAKNSNFPKLSEIAAIRVMLQDIDRAASNYSPTISHEVLK